MLAGLLPGDAIQERRLSGVVLVAEAAHGALATLVGLGVTLLLATR